MRLPARVFALAALVTWAIACDAREEAGDEAEATEEELASWDPYGHLAWLGNPAKQPALRARDRGRTDVFWSELDGQLFVESGPTADDFAQHEVGDCYFLAAMASLAAERPRLLRRLVDDNGDGTFTVHFSDGVAARANTPDVARPIDVVVDRSFPRAPNGELLYVRLRGARAIWPAILEKAYAKLQGSYQRTGGGFPRNAFFTLTGWHSAVTKLGPDLTREALYEEVRDALAAHDGVTLHTARGAPELQGVVGGHAYTVFGARRDPLGRMLLGLRNPWGWREPGLDGQPDGRNDGRFWIRAVDVLSTFHALTIAGPAVSANEITVEPSD